MAVSSPLRLAPEWDGRFTRMVGVSALGHVLALAMLVLVAGRGAPRPLPMVAYTVELTDPNALGGRLPAGAPGPNFSGGATRPAPAEPKPEPPPAPPAPAPPTPPAAPPAAPAPPPVAATPPAPPPPEPKAAPEPKPPVEEPTVRLPDQPKAPEPKPAEPKAEVKKPEAPPPPPPKAEVKKPEPPPPPKAEPPKAAPPKAEAKAAEPSPGPHAPASGTPGRSAAPSGGQETSARDAYAAAAERWRSRSGGGLGGEENGSGPLGAGGEGKGGGGQLVGVEFLAYRQRVIDTIKANWTNVIARPGLVAAVRFEIAPDGQVSAARLAQSSGNPAYDGSALRAVQHTTRLPPPPARYLSEFREFQIEFHSEESGGRSEG
jgi:colicin import membrane protein